MLVHTCWNIYLFFSVCLFCLQNVLKSLLKNPFRKQKRNQKKKRSHPRTRSRPGFSSPSRGPAPTSLGSLAGRLPGTTAGLGPRTRPSPSLLSPTTGTHLAMLDSFLVPSSLPDRHRAGLASSHSNPGFRGISSLGGSPQPIQAPQQTAGTSYPIYSAPSHPSSILNLAEVLESPANMTLAPNDYVLSFTSPPRRCRSILFTLYRPLSSSNCHRTSQVRNRPPSHAAFLPR